MVKNVTFVSFRGGDRPNRPPPWIRPCMTYKAIRVERLLRKQDFKCARFARSGKQQQVLNISNIHESS